MFLFKIAIKTSIKIHKISLRKIKYLTIKCKNKNQITTTTLEILKGKTIIPPNLGKLCYNTPTLIMSIQLIIFHKTQIHLDWMNNQNKISKFKNIDHRFQKKDSLAHFVDIEWQWRNLILIRTSVKLKNLDVNIVLHSFLLI